MKLCDWLYKSFSKLKKNNINKNDIIYLLSCILNKPQYWIFIFPNKILKKKQIIKLNYALERRINQEPIPYITNFKYFWSLKLYINKYVFIPRMDTEILINILFSYVKHSDKKKILDLGTGSGAIALAIAKNRSKCSVIGIDICKFAIKVAKKNAVNLNIKNVRFFLSNWFSNIGKKRFDIIVSNPPYIGIHEKKMLQQDVFFEPTRALFSNNKGMQDIEHIIQYSPNYLYPNGWIIIEHGWKQKILVQNQLLLNNFVNLLTVCDNNGIDRVTIGQYTKN
ncbi:peptide chain release factor N(5)-glutamine methyltransferase [Buchnera aphidicola (Kurisakia onigurumii)]|uniref:peptide chain release factor N(5)-glutamine methyltransferase n=1 Tax=Buchnera aphidicola TaxID=9 RepID=UPI0031B6980A